MKPRSLRKPAAVPVLIDLQAQNLNWNQAKSSPKSSPKSSIGTAKDLPPEKVMELALQSGLQHIVQSESLCFEQEIEAAQVMLQDPKSLLLFPLDVVFGAHRREERAMNPRFDLTVSAGQRKTSALTAFGSFVAMVPGSRRIWDQALLVADELYTNGSKNAWGDKWGLPEVEAGSPSDPGMVELFSEADSQRLVIGCRDSYGRLDVQSLIERIKTCYDQGLGAAIRRGSTGAGIGSFLIYDACVSYYVAVEPGRRSVVCAVMPLGVGSKQLGLIAKNLHLATYVSGEKK